VFLNSEGLPTYEGKEIGLAEMKLSFYPYDFSITVTANEQNSFFDVLEVAIQEIHPELKGKLIHLSHGVLKLPSGKMSSRTGSIISAESLINQTKEKVLEKIEDRDFNDIEKKNISEMVALAAIRYSILRQSIGGDIIFDFDKSLSFEGDSGPYLQYATVRAQAVLNKVDDVKKVNIFPDKVDLLEKLLMRFPEVIEKARNEYAPHHMVTYLTELASTFNSYYANNQILDDKDPLSSYRIELTKLFVQVMKKGLWILGIKVPERM
jgi:arginyl-tRNA synthetase